MADQYAVERKVVFLAEAQQMSAVYRQHGRTVVTTNGCFDLLHVGHVRCLQAARAEGDLMIVGLNSDASVRALKGPSRPVQPEADRAEILAALSYVDLVVIFEESLPLEFIAAVRPDIHVKGGDYEAATLPEYELVTGWGGTVVIVPLAEGRSTTNLLDAERQVNRGRVSEARVGRAR